jgi:NAD(P)-dependent dehydrogenase (short-subunit alcohol dehydrogenase family)/acyl dehydratase/putative sterol carrier protein
MALDLGSIGTTIGPVVKGYDWKDLSLYALGVGAGFEDLDYCYEDRLKVIPSFGIASIFDFLMRAVVTSKADLAGILHGEHEIVFHQPIPTSATLSTTGKITKIYDKGAGKGAVVIAESDTVDAEGVTLFTNVFTLFSRLDGGFGGENAPSQAFAFPDREPDFVEEATPPTDQPLVYRLSGDVFALHVNPDFARQSGFERPIMHGLCTLGYATRALVKHLVPGEPERLTRLKVRFSRTLYPGLPIRTLIWKVGENAAVYRTVNAATGDVVLDRGAVEWVDAAEIERRRARRGIRFDGRVAVVTGAGGGLGRVYALELAKRGAKVVVNDLGGPADGLGEGSSRPADAVVEEIRAAGGEATASYESVTTAEGGQRIVEAAVKAYGRLDILINNAGILRDRSLVKLDPESWGAVLGVHLDGAYNVTRPAFARMKEQGYGRIVMTTSAAGLYGNFGQSNYSAAKLGLVGLMNTLKLEGKKAGIKVNTVAPLAASRLTEGVFPPELLDKVKPEYVAPIVLFLCSRECEDSGQVVNAGPGAYSLAAVVTGPGAVVGEPGAPPTPEQIERRLGEIDRLEGAARYEDAMAAAMAFVQAAQRRDAPAGGAAGEAAAAKPGLGGQLKAVFGEMMPAAFDAGAAAGIDVVFQFDISGDGGGQWYAAVKGGELSIAAGQATKPTVTIGMAGADFLELVAGKLDPMAAYSVGKLKVSGDAMKSRLIMKLFKFGR